MSTPANPDDLITWLRDQLDEDELSARAVLGADAASWDPYGYLPGEKRDYLTRHDPARVLAEVDAKRRILDEVVDEATGLDIQVDNEFRVGTRDTAAEPYLGDVLLKLLALPFADRPGYRPEWKP